MADVDNSAWNGAAAMSAAANSDDPAAAYKAICAGRREGDPSIQSSWALPHHKSPGDPPNADGVRNAESRLPQAEGLINKDAAKKHLDNHMAAIQASEKAGVLANVRALRAEHAREVPAGTGRMRAFPSYLRARLVQRDGRNFFEVDGYATVFDRGYQMWDMFGPYTESVDSHALDLSLARNPDVAFLLNHRGMTMARTTNGTLELSKDSTGLHTHAFLNADRQDVRDLASAINDGLIDEMSFAFMIDGDGGWEWNDDFSECRLTQIDINRGDVSAVNYGANPYTSIAARAAEWLTMTEAMPPAVARAAFMRISHRDDIDLSDIISDEPEVVEPEPEIKTPAERTAGIAAEQPKGYSVGLMLKRYQASHE